MLDDKTKQELRQRLLDEKRHLENQIERQNQDIHEMALDQANENTYSNHPAEAGTHLEDMDRTANIQLNLQETLEQVKRALERMDEGAYGLSEISGREIPAERLEVLPWATTLVEEQAQSKI